MQVPGRGENPRTDGTVHAATGGRGVCTRSGARFTGGGSRTGGKPGGRDCPRGGGGRGDCARSCARVTGGSSRTGRKPGDGTVHAAAGGVEIARGVVRALQAEVRGRGENPGTDGTVHAATGGRGVCTRSGARFTGGGSRTGGKPGGRDCPRGGGGRGDCARSCARVTGGSSRTGRKPGDGTVHAAAGGVGIAREVVRALQAEVRGRGENPGTDGTVHAAAGGVGIARGVVRALQAEVRGRGENPGTDGTVHAATGDGALSRRVVAPWDSLVGPRVFADHRADGEFCGPACRQSASRRDCPRGDGGAWGLREELCARYRRKFEDGAKTRGQTGLSTRRRGAWGLREELCARYRRKFEDGAKTRGQTGLSTRRRDTGRFREELWRLGTVSSVPGFSRIIAPTESFAARPVVNPPADGTVHAATGGRGVCAKNGGRLGTVSPRVFADWRDGGDRIISSAGHGWGRNSSVLAGFSVRNCMG